MSILTEAYGEMNGPFGEKGPFYGPQGHRGVDFRRSRGDVVPAYEAGVCVAMGFSYYIGYWVVLRLHKDGKYAGWCHLQVGTRPDINAHVKVGEQVGKVAGPQDNPGDSWAGSHIHTTLSTQMYGIYEGWNLDPYPRIKAALTGTASDDIEKIDQGDIVPKTNRKVYKGGSRAISVGEWAMLPSTTLGGTYNLAHAPAGGEIGSITTWVKFDGLAPGKEVQVRLAVYSSNHTVKRTYPLTEVIGTGGGTFGTITQNYRLTKGEQLRLQVIAFQPGVTLERLESELHYWS